MTEYDSADIGRWQQAGGTRAGAHRPHLAIAVAVLAVAGGVLTGCSGQSRGGTDQPGVQGPSSVAPAGPVGEERLRQVLARFRADPDTTARITTALAP